MRGMAENSIEWSYGTPYKIQRYKKGLVREQSYEIDGEKMTLEAERDFEQAENYP